MVDIHKATKEGRQRDKKRKRLILKIGALRFHLTRKEALRIRMKLNKIKL